MALATSISVLLKADSTQFIAGMNKAKMSAQAIANFSKKVNTSLAGAAGQLAGQNLKLNQSMDHLAEGAKTAKEVMNQLSRSFNSQLGGLSKGEQAQDKYKKGMQELNNVRREQKRLAKAGSLDEKEVMTKQQHTRAAKALKKVLLDEMGATDRLAKEEKERNAVLQQAAQLEKKHQTAAQKKKERLKQLVAITSKVKMSDQARKGAMKEINRLYDEESGKTARLAKQKKRLKDANKQLFSSFKQLNTPLEKHNAQMKKLQILAMAAGKSTNWLKEAQKRLNDEFKKSTGGKYMKTTLRDRIAGGMNRAGMGGMAGMVGGEKFKAGRAAAGGRPGAAIGLGTMAKGAALFALYRGLRAGVGAFVEFEKSMARVQALTGATGAVFNDLQMEARSLATTTVFSADQVAEAMQFFALAGYEVSEIYGALPATLDLAVVGAMEVGEATDIAVKIMAGFGIEAKDFSGVVDVLSVAMTNANTSMVQLGNALKFVGPVAKASGYQIEGITAALMVLANAGLQGEMGGTALRNILMKLAKPSDEAEKKMRKLGFTAKDMWGSMKPLPTIITELNQVLGEMPTGEKLATLATMFEARALPGVAAMMGAGGEELTAFENQLKNSEGSAEKIKAIQMDTVGARTDILISVMKEVAIAIMSELAPMLKELLIVMARWVSEIGGLELTGAAGEMVAQAEVDRLTKRRDVVKAEETAAAFAMDSPALRETISQMSADRGFDDRYRAGTEDFDKQVERAGTNQKKLDSIAKERAAFEAKMGLEANRIWRDAAREHKEFAGINIRAATASAIVAGATMTGPAGGLAAYQALAPDRLPDAEADLREAEQNYARAVDNNTGRGYRATQASLDQQDLRSEQEKNLGLAQRRTELQTGAESSVFVQQAQIWADALGGIEDYISAMEEQNKVGKRALELQKKYTGVSAQAAEAMAQQELAVAAAREDAADVYAEEQRSILREKHASSLQRTIHGIESSKMTEEEKKKAVKKAEETAAATVQAETARRRQEHLDTTPEVALTEQQKKVVAADKERQAREESAKKIKEEIKQRERLSNLMTNSFKSLQESNAMLKIKAAGGTDIDVEVAKYRQQLKDAGASDMVADISAAARRSQLNIQKNLNETIARNKEAEDLQKKHRDPLEKFKERVENLRKMGLPDDVFQKEVIEAGESLGLGSKIEKSARTGALVAGTAEAFSQERKNRLDRGDPQLNLATKANGFLQQIRDKPPVQVHQGGIGAP